MSPFADLQTCRLRWHGATILGDHRGPWVESTEARALDSGDYKGCPCATAAVVPP